MNNDYFDNFLIGVVIGFVIIALCAIVWILIQSK